MCPSDKPGDIYLSDDCIITRGDVVDALADPAGELMFELLESLASEISRLRDELEDAKASLESSNHEHDCEIDSLRGRIGELHTEVFTHDHEE